MSDNTLNHVEGQDRVTRLIYWMRSQYPPRTFCSVAADLGVSAQSVSAMLRKSVIAPYRHTQLVNAGMPSELLPEPGVILPGRRRGSKRKQA